LTARLQAPEALEREQEDAALLLALIGVAEPLRVCLANGEAPVAVRRRAAECLGLLARRCGDKTERDRIADELEGWLRNEVLDVRIELAFDPANLDPAMVQELVEESQRQAFEALQKAFHLGQLPSGLGEDKLQQLFQSAVQDQLRRRLQQVKQQIWAAGHAPGWAEHDARLPLLQGASRGLQLAASADLPLFGSGPGRRVPMLTLTALKEGEGLRIRTEVVAPEVWKLPLPEWPGEAPQQLELVVVPSGDYTIGSPEEEAGRDSYTEFRQKCKGVNVEAQRKVSLKAFALVRHPITQAQWRAVATLPRQERDLNPTPSIYEAKGLWESHAQPGGMAVQSVNWHDCQDWLKLLNDWLKEEWPQLGVHGDAPQLALPSESQWEVACRAGASTPFHFGDTLDACWANYNGGYTHGAGRKGIFWQRPVPVGAFGLVNQWGLAEMHGQLHEWCSDRWHPDLVADVPRDGSPLESPDAELEGNQEQKYRLLRGGSWVGEPHAARAAMRYSGHPDYSTTNVGVRPGCFSPPAPFLHSCWKGFQRECKKGHRPEGPDPLQ
jgi:formylglycine-generating enzyme required for sulfatase activity